MKVEAIEGLACSLRENGQDMQEYEDDGDHLYIPSTGRKYVEARSGQNFAVHLHTRKYVLNSPDPADCINARISLDGKFAIGKILSINEHPLDYDVNVEGVGENRGGRYYMREFAFADLATGRLPSDRAVIRIVADDYVRRRRPGQEHQARKRCQSR